jgi:hypothetical protein
MLLVPFFWMIKFSGVLLECKEELMIVNSNGDELMVKGGAFVWKEWARQQFQCMGAINLDFLIGWEGSMVWCRRKKKLLWTALFKMSIVVFPCSVHGNESQLQCHMCVSVHHSDQFPSYRRSYGSFPLMENPMLRAPALAVPLPECKRKTIYMSARYK